MPRVRIVLRAWLALEMLGHFIYSRNPMVVVVGMPKAGTSAIRDYFRCNEWRTSHWICAHGYCGYCVTDFLERTIDKKHTFSDQSQLLRKLCGDYDVYAQIDFTTNNGCLFPQIAVRQLAKALPKTCFILNTRELDHWASSVMRWGDMLHRLVENCPIFPRNKTGLIKWAEEHYAVVRDTFKEVRCSLELDIESPDAGNKLALAFNGTNSTCWHKANQNLDNPISDFSL